jgi:hypothetical protein
MRPRGELRLALVDVARVQGHGGSTWKGMAHAAQVGLAAARATVLNMARAGELVVVGQVREPGVCRPMNLYAVPAEPAANADDGGAQLARCWASFC